MKWYELVAAGLMERPSCFSSVDLNTKFEKPASPVSARIYLESENRVYCSVWDVRELVIVFVAV